MDSISVFAALAAIIAAIGIVTVRLSVMDKRLKKLIHLEAKLDALLKNTGIDFDLMDSIPGEVVEALARGRKIEAIKHYRKAKEGVSLREAKEIIDEIQHRISSGDR